MAAEIRRFRSRPARLRQDERADLRSALLPFRDGDGFRMPRQEVRLVVAKALALIDRETASQNGWSFVMLSPSQNALVVNFLAAHSERPLVALRLWALCFEHLRTDTGEIVLSRGEMAERLGIEVRTVSSLVSELVAFGALSRTRDGRSVRYFMNPNVGTHLSGKARDDAQRAAVKLALVGCAERGVERRRRAYRPAVPVF